MSFTNDTTTNIGVTRILIADMDETRCVFEDEEITAILILESAADGTQYPRFAAATLLISLATNYTRLLGVIKLLDLEVDAAKMATAFLAQAKQYRLDENSTADFDYIEWVNDPFSARERIYKQWLRMSG